MLKKMNLEILDGKKKSLGFSRPSGDAKVCLSFVRSRQGHVNNEGEVQMKNDERKLRGTNETKGTKGECTVGQEGKNEKKGKKGKEEKKTSVN